MMIINPNVNRSVFTMRKRVFYIVLVLLLMFVFIMLPFPASDLRIRIHFDEIEGSSFVLYYTADIANEFTNTQSISQDIDHDAKQVEFTLPSSLENRITGLRLDFPNTEQLLCVSSITVSSAGTIKRQFNPCDFFSESGILHSNDINGLSLATAKRHAYILTSSDDPYIVLSPDLCRRITDCYSHFRLTRLGICIFILGCFFFAKRNIFSSV